jgi:RNA polymerase primary sigma factor
VTIAIKNAGRYLSLDAPLVQGEENNMYDVLLSEDASNPDKELLTD